jgi:hypothetical protein
MRVEEFEAEFLSLPEDGDDGPKRRRLLRLDQGGVPDPGRNGFRVDIWTV